MLQEKETPSSQRIANQQGLTGQPHYARDEVCSIRESEAHEDLSLLLLETDG